MATIIQWAVNAGATIGLAWTLVSCSGPAQSLVMPSVQPVDIAVSPSPTQNFGASATANPKPPLPTSINSETPTPTKTSTPTKAPSRTPTAIPDNGEALKSLQEVLNNWVSGKTKVPNSARFIIDSNNYRPLGVRGSFNPDSEIGQDITGYLIDVTRIGNHYVAFVGLEDVNKARFYIAMDIGDENQQVLIWFTPRPDDLLEEYGPMPQSYKLTISQAVEKFNALQGKVILLAMHFNLPPGFEDYKKLIDEAEAQGDSYDVARSKIMAHWTDNPEHKKYIWPAQDQDVWKFALAIPQHQAANKSYARFLVKAASNPVKLVKSPDILVDQIPTANQVDSLAHIDGFQARHSDATQ